MTSRLIWISGLKEPVIICACQSSPRNISYSIALQAVLNHLTSSAVAKVFILIRQHLMNAFADASAITLLRFWPRYIAKFPDLFSRDGIQLLPCSCIFVFMLNPWLGSPRHIPDRLAQAVKVGTGWLNNLRGASALNSCSWLNAMFSPCNY